MELNYESVRPLQHPPPSSLYFPSQPQTQISVWRTSGRCVIAAVLEKLLFQAKGSPLSCPSMGHLGTYVRAQLVDVTERRRTNETHMHIPSDPCWNNILLNLEDNNYLFITKCFSGISCTQSCHPQPVKDKIKNFFVIYFSIFFSRNTHNKTAVHLWELYILAADPLSFFKEN